MSALIRSIWTYLFAPKINRVKDPLYYLVAKASKEEKREFLEKVVRKANKDQRAALERSR